ncbi:DUF2927 domain-containing protein [Roseovarius autotrophicus]|uniref:DUF2927 domain-containing protein n=1 Tax=Roseovarius autotrophicus TaxID=2824121 RepID=UPI0019EB061F|nr:DUF2927 domain-containing protein [Roseovarius autotrophicus]MBE0453844.1 DUF2927 domain-containing protein [Roseovarius sp.]
MRGIILPVCLILGACVAVPRPDEAPASRAALPGHAIMPPMKGFSDPRPSPPQRSNQDILRDFLDLSFQMESGRILPSFSRFEGPITVRVTGTPPATLMADLNRLIHRLRSEAGIDIRRVGDDSANIVIEAVSRAEIRRALPSAACFVVPNIESLSEYRGARGARRTDWTQITRREKIAIFVPNDASPQETRDCLHEELAQAIGPLNDLYRLSDSVFNDDNVHAVLTGFDMLILRAYYAPGLRAGMTRREVEARLPAILSRLNPDGDSIAPRFAGSTPRAWIEAIQTALGPGARGPARRAAAADAVRIAQAAGWTDHRRAFSHFALGRLTQAGDPEFAQHQFMLADRFYEQTPGTAIHRAFIAAQLAGHALARGHSAEALTLIAPNLGVAERHENAALLATLKMLQSEALALEGRSAEARAVRLDSLGWARYGYGADWAVQAQLREVSALNPLTRSNGAR